MGSMVYYLDVSEITRRFIEKKKKKHGKLLARDTDGNCLSAAEGEGF